MVTLVPLRFARELGLTLIWMWLSVLGVAIVIQAPAALERSLVLATLFVLTLVECWVTLRQPEPPTGLVFDHDKWSALFAEGTQPVGAFMHSNSSLFGSFAVLDLGIEGRKVRCYLLKSQNSGSWCALQHQWGLRRLAESE
ncbi:MAG: hypothetical protein AAFQ99_03790 [Pseudomonadota bacterium]